MYYRSDPDYFNVVSNPIDMLRIQAKMKMEEYDTVDQFAVDVHLLVSNAKAYYKVCSWIEELFFDSSQGSKYMEAKGN